MCAILIQIYVVLGLLQFFCKEDEPCPKNNFL